MLPIGRSSRLRAIAACLSEQGGGQLFALDSDLLADTVVQSLFDLRVIHLVQHQYASAAQRGRPLSLYALDFGATLALGSPDIPGNAAGASGAGPDGRSPGAVPDVSAIISPPDASR